MNLAEFPLTVLSTRASPGVKTLEFKDTITGKSGELINRSWIITGADKFGLPTSSDDEVILGLLKLTVDDGMRGRKIYFTRYELLKILRWTTEGRNYTRLQKALDRLSGVRIKASNAFFDNDSKLHSTKNFGLIDEYEINSGRDADVKNSFFVWSDVLFKSFQVGFIKKLDLDFYLGLKSAVTKRLYRYLDKHFWYRSIININIFTLAHEKIGVSRNYRYASSLRQQLDPAFEELIEAKFLESVDYHGRGEGTEIRIVAGKGKNLTSPKNVAQEFRREHTNKEHRDKEDQMEAREESGAVRGDCRVNDTQAEAIRLLIDRGLNERQVLKIIAGKSEEAMKRIGEIVKYYDSLRERGSSLISRSPLGWLYRAIERADTFVLPSELSKNQLKGAQTEIAFNNNSKTERFQQGRNSSLQDGRDEEAQYLVYRRKELQRIREGAETKLIEKLHTEVEHALEKLKPLISVERFKETIVHGVDEKLAKLFAVPSFEEWKSSLWNKVSN